MRPLHVLLPVLAVALLGAPSAAPAQTWYPLETGFFWSHISPAGPEMRTVEGSVVIRGVPTQAILYTPSVNNEDLRNYWTTGPDGDVFLHGFSRPGSDGRAYDPPALVLDAPLFVGKTWDHPMDVYALSDGQFLFSIVLSFEVYEEGVVAVPAGSFETFGVGYAVPDLPGGGADALRVDGSVVDAGRGGFTQWYYAQNVGWIRYLSIEWYDLVAYGAPTDLTAETWAGVKNLFR